MVIVTEILSSIVRPAPTNSSCSVRPAKPRARISLTIFFGYAAFPVDLLLVRRQPFSNEACNRGKGLLECFLVPDYFIGIQIRVKRNGPDFAGVQVHVTAMLCFVGNSYAILGRYLNCRDKRKIHAHRCRNRHHGGGACRLAA